MGIKLKEKKSLIGQIVHINYYYEILTELRLFLEIN